MNRRLLFLLPMLFGAFTPISYAQESPGGFHTDSVLAGRPATVSVKTNLLYDATTSFSLGTEFRLGRRTSLDASGSWNPFTFSRNRKWKHLMLQPEVRWWTKEVFAGHFFGLHAHYIGYNVSRLPEPFSPSMRENRYQGWGTGAGVSYGYRWNFTHRWGMEASVGVGYAYLAYDKFPCYTCGAQTGSGTKHYFGPTKAAVSLVYTIGGRKTSPLPAPVYLPLAPEPEPAPVEPYTPQLAVCYVMPQSEAVKSRSEAGSAYLDFAAGQWEIITGFKNNTTELAKIHTLIETVKNDSDATITGISIAGYASPEGSFSANQTLSAKRAESLKRHLKTLYGFSESLFDVEGRGEDWIMLDSLVSHSPLTYKYSLLEIIRSTEAADVRERRLSQLLGGTPYKELKALLYPNLRRSDYRLHYTVLPFTVEKGREVFRTKPSHLSLNEMYLIANTYQAGSDAFNEVFETAARLFPDSDEANLNAAAGALERRDGTAAAYYLKRVKEQDGVYHNNIGVLHGLRGEWVEAVEAFRKGAEAGNRQAVGNAPEAEQAVKSRHQPQEEPINESINQ